MVPPKDSMRLEHTASPKPVPLPGSLVVEKGIVHLLQIFRRNSRARVLNLNLYSMRALPCPEADLSAGFWYGIHGIEYEVYEDLPNFFRLRLEDGDVRIAGTYSNSTLLNPRPPLDE